MIENPNADGGSEQQHEVEIPFPGIASLKAGAPSYRPYGHIIQLDWEPGAQGMAGNLHLPQGSKAGNLPFYRVKVLAVGPDTKLVKVGDWVLLPMQVILHAKWDGHVAYFSSEDKILAVVSGGE